MNNTLVSTTLRVFEALNQRTPDTPLLARISVECVFLQSGWGKVTHLDRTAAFFADLGIPAPLPQAILVANTELIAGGLVLLGLATRAASVPLIIVMIVAINTSSLENVHNLLDFLALDEFLYLAVLVWLTVQGAGRWSVDHLMYKRLTRTSIKPQSGQTFQTI